MYRHLGECCRREIFVIVKGELYIAYGQFIVPLCFQLEPGDRFVGISEVELVLPIVNRQDKRSKSNTGTRELWWRRGSANLSDVVSAVPYMHPGRHEGYTGVHHSKCDDVVQQFGGQNEEMRSWQWSIGGFRIAKWGRSRIHECMSCGCAIL
jgi:hypothetical protein